MITEWPISTNPYKENPPVGSAAIVMIVRGQLKFAQLSYYAIRYFTDHPHMICFVNNQSDLKTRNTIQGISVNHKLWMIHDHRDFDKGALLNVGFRHCFKSTNVEYGVLIDSGVIVGPEWLSKLINHLTLNTECGVVSPQMNILPEHSFRSVTGSCMVFRRNLFDQISGFKEGLDYGEDIQFCKDVEDLGMFCDCASDVEVHRFQGITRRSLESAIK